MVHFVGAGPGAPDLLTLRGAELLKQADTVIYAGSLVNPALLGFCREDCVLFNSAEMSLEQIMTVIEESEAGGKTTVRLQTGDPSIYGAIREQTDSLRARGIPFDITPGVSSFCGAAASLQAEYTLPGVSQTVILTRIAGRTGVPDRESIRALAAHGSTMVIFLSAGQLELLQQELLAGAYTKETPVALVYKATWPEERILHTALGSLSEAGRNFGETRTVLVLVGDFLGKRYERSRLYDPDFSTGFRESRP